MPIDVYRGLMETKFPPEIVPHIESVVGKFSDYTFAGHDLSTHLARFIKTISKLIAYLDKRSLTALADLTSAIDVLDHFTSTSKWWNMSRKEPGFIIRPPNKDPRDFMKALPIIKIGSASMSRITGSIERLSRFLNEHEITSSQQRDDLCESLASVWVLMSAFFSKNQGRNQISENDFEQAYDTARILLFYSTYDDFRALTAVRRLGTNPRLPNIAGIGLTPGFESRLESSIAGQLEQNYYDNLQKSPTSPPAPLRTLLTNSLRILAQIEAFTHGMDSIDESHYDQTIRGAMKALERTGMSPDLLHDKSAVIDLFNKLRASEEFEYSRLVPRLISLILLVSGGTMDSSKEVLSADDMKRGLILIDSIVSD